MDDFDARRGDAVAREFRLDDLPVADERDLDAQFAPGKKSTGHNRGRCVISTHRVEGDQHQSALLRFGDDDHRIAVVRVGGEIGVAVDVCDTQAGGVVQRA